MKFEDLTIGRTYRYSKKFLDEYDPNRKGNFDEIRFIYIKTDGETCWFEQWEEESSYVHPLLTSELDYVEEVRIGF